MPGRRSAASSKTSSKELDESYEMPASPPSADQPFLASHNSFATDPDSSDLSQSRLSRPRWSRNSSRYTPDEHRYSSYVDGPVSSAAAYQYDPALNAGHPAPIQERPFTPPFLAAESRSGSRASGSMLAPFGSDGRPDSRMTIMSRNSDYDSVYQLWRSSGTPSMFQEFEDSRRGSNANDLEKIEQYRAGAFSPPVPPKEQDQALHKGEAGIKGPKDYRAVGLAKYGRGKDQQRMSAKKRWMIIGGVAGLIAVLVIVVVVPITTILLKDERPKNSAASSGSNAGSGSGSNNPSSNNPDKVLATSGTNGSTIDLGNGQSFTYINNFGGHWASQPLNNSARAQNYTPPLSEEFDFARNRILGVNLGGWLVTEPFIVPALYEPYENTSSPAVDEFTLSQKYLAEGGADNLRAKMTEHYDSFITEQDFARIAGAGLNWVRLPIGFWAFETYANEPYLEAVSWGYVLKAIQWARKYGLRINLDLHAVPGSQNGYNHSGRVGFINYLQGLMGKANGQRTMDYIRQIAQFISQPEISPVVPMFSVINEPYAITIGQPALESWYADVYTMLRSISGLGAGKGPYMTIHDGFLPLNTWQGFLQGGDRVSWDTHPYICFSTQNNDPWPVQALKPCNQFTPLLDNARQNMGVAMGGEMSLAINDCGLFLNGVTDGHRYDGSYTGPVAGNYPYVGSCQPFDDWENYSDEMKQGLRTFALTSMESLRDFFFWTWKIGDSLRTGKPTSPMWSYSLGLENGWMPTNPLAQSPGACAAAAASQSTSVPSATWGSAFQLYQTGNAASYAPETSQYPWPPASLVSANTPVSALPSYTATKAITPVPVPTISVTATVVGVTAAPTFAGWFNSADSSPFYTRIGGCNYPADQYNLTGFSASGWPCGGGNARREIVAHPTPAPRR